VTKASSSSLPADEFTFLDLDSQAGTPPGDFDPTRKGTRLGDYVVLGVLGQGAMSVVLRGVSMETKRPVAIKILREKLGRSADARERLRREAVAMSQAKHPHVAQVFCYGIVRGRPFMVMEVLPSTVADVLSEARDNDEPIPIHQAAELMRMTLEGLGAVHALSLLHRDVKPANLLLDSTGRVKVADFGLVKMLSDPTQTAITGTGATVGTPLYMAPEQSSGDKLDHRVDLYAVGVALFELLTNERPYPGARTLIALRELQASGPAPGVRSLREEIPPAMEEVVARLLEFRAEDRYADARQAAAALEAATPFPDRLAIRVLQKDGELYRGELSRGGKLVLGRATEAEVTLVGGGLSRFHAQLELGSRGLMVSDLGSTNGTFLAGRRVTEPCRVTPRDRLRLGKEVRCEVRWLGM
jgi:serine/threonine protein kinase